MMTLATLPSEMLKEAQVGVPIKIMPSGSFFLIKGMIYSA
jgi:hypothetical protein